ncbi:MAG TPA: FkbM family methyltransferase [Anaerolineales bacterium]|nr:FkbM family methyltransferase [Anaerolineales bacterium]
MQSSLPSLLGLLRSLLTYYAIPGRIRRLTTFYAQFIHAGDLCFDIGAHVGNHTLALHRLNTRVIAVEPQPPFTQLLQRLYGSRSGITLRAEALGPTRGTASLAISSRTPTVSTLSAAWTRLPDQTPSFARVTWDRQIQVPVIPLNALIAEYGLPAFCKIDVEGYELEVLRGLSQPIPLLAFEYLPAQREIALACLDRLAELGDYTYNYSVGEQMHLAPTWLTPAQTAQYLRFLPPTSREGNLYAKIQRLSDSTNQQTN